MFESDPILWLQQFSTPWFDALMRFMSWIGEAWFYTPACALALAAWRVPWIDPAIAGEVTGTLLCIGALMRLGWTEGDTGWPRRVARVAVGLASGYAVIWLLDSAYAATGWPERHPGAFFFAVGGIAAALLGAIAACRLLRLYRPPPAAGGAGT